MNETMEKPIHKSREAIVAYQIEKNEGSVCVRMIAKMEEMIEDS